MKFLNKPSTTTVIGLTTIILCFVILILTLVGLVHSSETMQTQIVQLVSSLMVLVLGFYFGATHKSESPNQNNQQMTTVFWTIQSLNDQVIEVNGVQSNYQNCQALVNANQSYQIVQDDTNVYVLIYTGSGSSTLKLNGQNGIYLSTSVQAQFHGGRPVRPK